MTSAIVGVGDVDGDGCGDMLAADVNFYGGVGKSQAGAVYLYLGSSAGLSEAPAWTFKGTQSNQRMGTTMAAAGDLNGDGYADFVVGTPAHKNAAGNTGAGIIHVFHGGPAGPAATPDRSYEGVAANAAVGRAAGGAGNVNGDAFGDLYILSAAGVSVYYGSAAGVGAAVSWALGGSYASAAGAGDVNGDHVDDFMACTGPTQRELDGDGILDFCEAIDFYNGQVGGLPVLAAWSIISKDTAGFGASLAGAGDVNGDGFADIVVGHPQFPVGVTNPDGSTTTGPGGAFYLYRGGAAGPQPAPSVVEKASKIADALGASVAAAGDVNGDGYADVVVGEPGYDTASGTGDAGRARVYLGGPAGLVLPASWTAEGDRAGAAFGSLVNAGDVNGDGIGDLAVSATSAKIVYVFHGSTDAPPDLETVDLQQYKLDGTTVIAKGSLTDEAGFVVKAPVNDPEMGRVRLRVQVAETSETFSDSGPFHDGAPVPSGTLASVTVSGLVSGKDYHWRAQVVDAVNTRSNWTSFGTGTDTPPTVEIDLGTLVNHPPVIQSIGQVRISDGSEVPAGSVITDEGGIVIKGIASDPEPGNEVRFDVEVRPLGTAFSNQATNSAVVPSGAEASIVCRGVEGPYHWQYRLIDTSPFLAATAWTAHGSGGADFVLHFEEGSKGLLAQCQQAAGGMGSALAILALVALVPMLRR